MQVHPKNSQNRPPIAMPTPACRVRLLGVIVALGAVSCARAGGAPCFVGPTTRGVGVVGGGRWPNDGLLQFGCPLRTNVALAVAAKNKKAQGKAAPSSGGFGAKTTTTKSVDAAALLRRSMELYDAIEKERNQAEQYEEDEGLAGVREYVVCVRSKAHDAVSDWVPSACRCVVWQGGDVSEVCTFSNVPFLGLSLLHIVGH